MDRFFFFFVFKFFYFPGLLQIQNTCPPYISEIQNVNFQAIFYCKFGELMK